MMSWRWSYVDGSARRESTEKRIGSIPGAGSRPWRSSGEGAGQDEETGDREGSAGRENGREAA